MSCPNLMEFFMNAKFYLCLYTLGFHFKFWQFLQVKKNLVLVPKFFGYGPAPLLPNLLSPAPLDDVDVGFGRDQLLGGA